MTNELYDVIIVGGGPAGLTAALYASRRALKTLLVSKDIGGQASKTFEIENYPGIDKITGPDLTMTMKKQAEKFGTEFLFDEVSSISASKNLFSVQALSRTIDSKSLILASGKKPRELNVPGEHQFKGKGVCYCATCDAPFFKGKTVVVVGGGNSALDAALYLTKFATKIYLVHRSEFRAEQVMIDAVAKNKQIETIVPDEIEKIEGEARVSSVTLKSGKKLMVDGVMVEVGYVVDNSILKGLVKLNEKDQILTDENQATSHPGVFAAGDVTTTQFKQIVISAGEGAKAALATYEYLRQLDGKQGLAADWH